MNCPQTIWGDPKKNREEKWRSKKIWGGIHPLGNPRVNNLQSTSITSRYDRRHVLLAIRTTQSQSSIINAYHAVR